MNRLARTPRRRASLRPRFECLEDRALMATFATFTVDDSYAMDNPAQHKYNTIQEAVDAASPGDLIKVLPGTYEESVTVAKKLTIEGAGAKLSAAENAAKASILDPIDNGNGAPAFGFNLQANDIVIKGFTIGELDSNTDANGSVGIQTSASFSGYQLLNNVVENNSIGVYLNTSTAAPAHQTTVSGNTIRNNNEDFGVAAASGNGIYSDQGARNVRIMSNTFAGQQNEDVIFVAPTALQTNITVQNNTLRDSSGIFFINVADSRIQGNLIERSFANAIELAGGNNHVTVQNNILRDVGTDGYNGIFLHDEYGVGANTHNTIMGNTIVHAGLSGIVIRDSSNNTVKNNTVSGSVGLDLSNPTWGNGISLEGATDNTVEGNVLRDSAHDGIRLDPASVDNVLRNNLALGNDDFDYFDASTGAGTAGTGNVWTGNRGETSNVMGLISRRDHDHHDHDVEHGHHGHHGHGGSDGGSDGGHDR